MDGLFVTVDGRERRPTSKKEVKALSDSPECIYVENTSMFGGWSGRVSDLPSGKVITFVGPDPYSKRSFYGTIERRSDGKVVVK